MSPSLALLAPASGSRSPSFGSVETVARTQAANYDARRAAIIDKAAELYARNGFLGCSIANLAEAAGMSKSLLYHYFSSKEETLFAIMQGHVEALRQAADAVAEEPDPELRLAALTHRFMALYVDAANRQKVLVNDLDKLPADQRETIVATQRHLLDVVDRILSDRAPSLATERDRRRALTMIYFGMINWTHTWYDPSGALDADAIADLVVSTFLSGMPVGEGHHQ